ncbi:MAG: hypothetical protein HGB29_05660 [Chlorobiaceae bacterium]|nr:hypothetical protein [Chlorobiaceae bacterium]NTW74334.1 hypothetical protein [Chlorobiaceae bacterium]
MEHQIPVVSVEQEPPVNTPAEHQEIPEQIREISERVAQAFTEFKESETYGKILEGKETAREYIRTNPLASFGYALGAGLFMGLLMKRKK